MFAPFVSIGFLFAHTSAIDSNAISCLMKNARDGAKLSAPFHFEEGLVDALLPKRPGCCQ